MRHPSAPPSARHAKVLRYLTSKTQTENSKITATSPAILASLNLPASLASIGDGAYGGCASLTNITLPDTLQSLGIFAFNRCSNVTAISIGAGTNAEAVARMRALSPEQWFLVPGVGAQGGDLQATLRAGLRPDGSGLLINTSRALWQAADAGAAARELVEQINQFRPVAV